MDEKAGGGRFLSLDAGIRPHVQKVCIWRRVWMRVEDAM